MKGRPICRVDVQNRRHLVFKHYSWICKIMLWWINNESDISISFMSFQSPDYHCLPTVSSWCTSHVFLFSLSTVGFCRPTSPPSVSLGGCSSHILNDQPTNQPTHISTSTIRIIFQTERVGFWEVDAKEGHEHSGWRVLVFGHRIQHFSRQSLLVGTREEISYKLDGKKCKQLWWNQERGAFFPLTYIILNVYTQINIEC